MVEILARVTTTHGVNQGSKTVRLTKESLEDAAKQANGDRAIPFTVGHDPFCMPIGKTTEAWVEPFEDEHALMARTYVEDDIHLLTHSVLDTQLVCLDFKEASKPFIRRYGDTEETAFIVGVDWANFNSIQKVNEFTNDVEQIDDGITCKTLGRHSLGPEPFIEFVFSNPEISAALAWMLWRAEKFIRYTVDETLRKIADDISDSLSDKIRGIHTAYGNRQSEDDRPVLSKIVIPGDMDLILLIRTACDEEFQNLDLTKLTAEMENYGDLLECAEEATFARLENREWKFQYLKTRTGKVIGTPECYERTIKKYQGMKGVSIGLSADGEDISLRRKE